MNPFTESTVARPLAEARPQAANEAASHDPQASPHDAASGAPAPPPHAGARRRPPRNPRSLRLVRKRAAGLAMGLALALGLSTAWAVNVNSATAQQLETITGIGPKTAQTIIDERTRGGSFESFDDLAERVKGIGPKKAQSLQAAGLTVGQGEGAAAPSPASAAQRKAGK